MDIFANLTEEELKIILELRGINQKERYPIVFGDNGFELYLSDKELAEYITNEMDEYISTVTLNVLVEKKYEVSNTLHLNHRPQGESRVVIKFREDRQTATYLKFCFDIEHNITSIAYINKNGDEINGTIEETLEYRNENPLAGVYDVLNQFKVKVLGLKPKRRKPSKDSKVVVLSRSHKIRFHQDQASKIQDAINKLIRAGAGKECKISTSSSKEKNGMRKVCLELKQNHKIGGTPFKTTIETNYKSQEREISFLVFEDTLEYVSHEVEVSDSTNTSYLDPKNEIEQEFLRNENENLMKLSLIEQIDWIIENKI